MMAHNETYNKSGVPAKTKRVAEEALVAKEDAKAVQIAHGAGAVESKETLAATLKEAMYEVGRKSLRESILNIC